MNSISNVEQQLHQQRSELSQRLASLEQEHGNAALRAAEGDVDALKDVPAIMREIEGLKDQQGTLDAAWTALEARMEEDARQSQIKEVEDAVGSLPTLSENAREQWVAFQDAIAAAGEAWHSFQTARKQLNSAASICRRAADRHRPKGTMMENYLDTGTARNLAAGLVWGMTEGEVEPRAGLESDPGSVMDRFDRALEGMVYHAERETKFALKHLQK